MNLSVPARSFRVETRFPGWSGGSYLHPGQNFRIFEKSEIYEIYTTKIRPRYDQGTTKVRPKDGQRTPGGSSECPPHVFFSCVGDRRGTIVPLKVVCVVRHETFPRSGNALVGLKRSAPLLQRGAAVRCRKPRIAADEEPSDQVPSGGAEPSLLVARRLMRRERGPAIAEGLDQSNGVEGDRRHVDGGREITTVAMVGRREIVFHAKRSGASSGASSSLRCRCRARRFP